MKRVIKTYKWLLAIVLLWGCFSTAYAYEPVTQPSSWRTTPTMSSDVQPNYQFRSTSTYKPIVGQTPYISRSTYAQTSYRPRRSAWDEEGEGIGNVYTPIGDVPFILMALMAGIYVIWKKKRKKIHELFAYFKKKQ